MDALSQIERLGPSLAGVAGGIKPDQVDNPTACANFTVRGVLEHMIGGATVFAAAFRGQPAPEAPPAADDDEIVGAFGAALDDLVAAISSPGALDRTIEAPFGAVPGDTFARYVAFDGLVHGWDLATATGQSYDPPEDVVAEADRFAHGLIDGMRDGDTFADAKEAPAGATPIERLVAYTGRTV